MTQTRNWQDLEIFHAVLEQGSFSGAARHLGVSQPTVSRHSEVLERNLGRREAAIDLRWNAPSEPDVISRALGSFHLGLVATQGYLQRHGRPRGTWCGCSR